MRLRRGRARVGPYVGQHPLLARREAVIDYLTGLGVVREAAMVARMFRLDPVSLLNDDADEWPMVVRVACARFIAAQEEAAAKRAQDSR